MPASADDHALAGARERGRLVARAGAVGLGTLASRVLGLLRDMALAALFDRAATDAWWVAFTIPNALRQLLGEGAVASAVVPVLSEKLARDGPDAAKPFFARVRGASLVALFAATALGMLFAGPLTELFAAGYHAHPGQFERTAALTRAVFPYILFMGTAALGSAALNANRRFAVAAFAPGLLNVALLAAAFALPGVLAAHGRDPLLALAVGALVGGVLQVAAQWPSLRAIGYVARPSLVLDRDVAEVLRRIAPLTFGIGIYYVDLVLSRRFLSELGTGAQSYFSWAMRVCDFPQGIFVLALSTAALPSLSTLAAKGARDEFAKTWVHGMGLAMFVAVPASVALATLGEPVVVAPLRARALRRRRGARDSSRAALAGGGHLDGRGRAADRPRALRPRRHAHAGRGQRDRPARVHRARGRPPRALGSRRDQRGRRRVERGPDGAAAGGPPAETGHHLRPRLSRGRWARTVVASLLAGAGGWAAARLGSGAVAGFAGLAAFGATYALASWATKSPELSEIVRAVRLRLARGRASA